MTFSCIHARHALLTQLSRMLALRERLICFLFNDEQFEWLIFFYRSNWHCEQMCAGFNITSHPDDPLICCYTSPIMRRAAELRSATDVVFVDSTSTVDADGVSVTFLLTATQAGAVPLCVLLHSGQSEEVIQRGIFYLCLLYQEFILNINRSHYMSIIIIY